MGTAPPSSEAAGTARPAGRLLAPAAVGVGLAALTAGVAAVLDERLAFVALAVLLGMIAGAYLGFAAADGRVRALGVESAGITITLGLAVAAVVLDAPVLLAAGYAFHGLWDLAHHPRALDTAVPGWYPPFCLVYDVAVGVFVLAWF